MKKQLILIGLISIMAIPVSWAGKPGEEIKTEKKTPEPLKPLDWEEHEAHGTKPTPSTHGTSTVQPEQPKTIQEIQKTLSSVQIKLKAARPEHPSGKPEGILFTEATDAMKALSKDDIKKIVEHNPKDFLEHYATPEFFAVLQPLQLEAIKETLEKHLTTLSGENRLTLLHNLAEITSIGGYFEFINPEAAVYRTSYELLMADIFNSLTVNQIIQAFENQNQGEQLSQIATRLAAIIKPSTQKMIPAEKLYASLLNFTDKLVHAINVDAKKSAQIADVLLSWIRTVVPKDKIIEVLSTVDFSKMAAANNPKMYEDWILLLKDLPQVPGIIAANVFTNYLNTAAKTEKPDDYIEALEFVDKNFEAQKLASFLQPFTNLQESIKKQLESLIANKQTFSSMRLIKVLEKFASPETLMTIKIKFITDPGRTSKESLRALPKEELDFIVTTLADLNNGIMKIDDITYGILSNVEAALNDVTSELEAFKKNKKFPKDFDNLSKEARQMFYDESLTPAEKQKLGELQKQSNNLSATKEELINLITPWNFSFQKWEWVRKIFPKKVTFKYEPAFMKWNNDRISKELFNGVKYIEEMTTREFIPSFDAFFKKWTYFPSEDPQLASTQQWLMQQATARFNDFLIVKHTDPQLTDHLLKNPEMQKCFYDLEAQRGMGTSWLSYFVGQALPNKEAMRNLSFPLFKIYLDDWFKDDTRHILNMALKYANTLTDTQLDYILKQKFPITGLMLNTMANAQFTTKTFEKITSPERRKKILETLAGIAHELLADELLQEHPTWTKEINQMIQLFNDELSKIKPAA